MNQLLICLAFFTGQESAFEKEAQTLAQQIPAATETQLDRICERLAQIGPEARAALPALTKRTEFPQCWDAIVAMGPEAIPTFRTALQSKNPKDRKAVLSAIACARTCTRLRGTLRRHLRGRCNQRRTSGPGDERTRRAAVQSRSNCQPHCSSNCGPKTGVGCVRGPGGAWRWANRVQSAP